MASRGWEVVERLLFKALKQVMEKHGKEDRSSFENDRGSGERVIKLPLCENCCVRLVPRCSFGPDCLRGCLDRSSETEGETEAVSEDDAGEYPA